MMIRRTCKAFFCHFRSQFLALAIGLSGALLSLTPYASLLEEKVGLDLLFWMRGERTPPPEIVVVGIDRDTANRLELPDNPTLWSRRLHADAVTRLTEAGAELIAFDIFFEAPHPDEDEVFARAIRASGRVILSDFLKLKHLQGDVFTESLEHPPQALTDAALTTAPFLLSQGAESFRFLSWHGAQRESPTLPTAVMQAYRHRIGAGRSATAPDETIDRSDRVFNHYGRAGTITRIPYHVLFTNDAARLDLRGKIALIGLTENFVAGHQEGVYFSPYSPVSSLELAATALANLLDERFVYPLFDTGGQVLWLSAWGVLIGAAGLAGSMGVMFALVGIAVAVYIGIAVRLFADQAAWLPLTPVLFWQLPVGLATNLVDQYLRNRPPTPADATEGEFFGVCLASDAAQYSRLARELEDSDLGRVMKDYWARLMELIDEKHGGWIFGVAGDGMMAFWKSRKEDRRLCRRAATAAIDLLRAVDEFQRKHDVRLPIRIGLHCGSVYAGWVGRTARRDYRAMGDTVNTAARLEGLNKLLGTSLLVSEQLVDELAGFALRPCGRFDFDGRNEPVGVYELVQDGDDRHDEHADKVAKFRAALEPFNASQWQDAVDAFTEFRREFPDDGPARFFQKAALEQLNGGHGSIVNGVIRIGKAVNGALAAN